MHIQKCGVALIVALTCTFLNVSVGQRLTLSPDKGSSFNISSRGHRGSLCMICTGDGPTRACYTSLLLRDTGAVAVDFTCTKPAEVFSVEILREIVCSAKSCNGDIIQTESGSLSLLEFNRTFTWNLKASRPAALHIDFSKEGLRQIQSSESCADKHTYTLQAVQFTGRVAIGTYCRDGPIRGAQVPNRGRFTIDVPARQRLQPTVFNVSLRDEIKSLAQIQITPPDGTSYSEPLFPNYPDSFPDDDQMVWEFLVPPSHAQVYASRSSYPLLCSVDLRGEMGLSIHIGKTREGSACELKMNSVIQRTIAVGSGTIAHLSFQDCPPQELVLTATRIIECHKLSDCSKDPVPLTVPILPKCLPAHLSSVTWNLRPVFHGTVELLPPNGLRHSLPEHPCKNNMVISVNEGNGTAIGQFCPEGAIEKLQVHANVTVTASALGNTVLQSTLPILNFSFIKEITERYIFTVSLQKGQPVLLATPSWPAGMKSHSTVSWIISVPPKKEAHLLFANLSQPKCSKTHTNIMVQSQGSLEEMYSRREDEKAADKITVPENFYLNMTNCKPERGAFSVVTEITLHNNKNLILTVILSVVAVLLVVIATVLAVVFVVIRRKKRLMRPQVSIYNPSGTAILPGLNGFPRSREDNGSHVYASIEDTLVYAHLLREGTETGVHGEVDVYREFTGPTSGGPVLGAVAEPPEIGVYQPFVPSPHQAPPLPNRPLSHARTMVDTELCQSDGEDEQTLNT